MVATRHREPSVLFDRDRPWQNFFMEYETSKARYDAAFDAYHEIARQNAEHGLGGGTPSVADLQRERNALAVLEEARRAFLKTIAPTISAQH
jgi:hypothetical protein